MYRLKLALQAFIWYYYPDKKSDNNLRSRVAKLGSDVSCFFYIFVFTEYNSTKCRYVNVYGKNKKTQLFLLVSRKEETRAKALRFPHNFEWRRRQPAEPDRRAPSLKMTPTKKAHIAFCNMGQSLKFQRIKLFTFIRNKKYCHRNYNRNNIPF